MNPIDHTFNLITDELTHGGITGWCEIPKALELAAMVVALRPKVVVELGVWGGRSLLPMALACEAVDCGVVFAIDPWSAPASAEGYDAVNADWWSKQPHEVVYQNFVAHVHRLGLANRVAIERAKSDDAAVPEVIDGLHIDGQHSAQAVRDVQRWASHVRLGGITVMDDLEWTVDGVPCVKQAVEQLLALGFIELHRTKTEKGCWGFFQRISLPTPALAGKKSRVNAARALSAPGRKARK